jgi:hypothetical protein
MRDWQAFVRLNLGPLRTNPEREAAIVSELAAQLEQTFLNARARGLSADASIAEAEAQFPDWKQLAREINASAHKPRLNPLPGARGQVSCVTSASLLGNWRARRRSR